jgi:hypothetical protein
MKEEWEKVTIGDREYSFEALPAEDAFMVSLQLPEVFGDMISAAMPLLGESDSGKSKTIAEMLSGSDVTGVMANIFRGVKPDLLKRLSDKMIGTCFVTDKGHSKGVRCTYNHFNGKTLELYKVLFYSLRYNFADFFEGNLKGAIGLEGVSRDA